MMDYPTFIKQVEDIVRDRHGRLGDPQKFFERVVQLFTLTTGVQLTNREAFMFMHCVKLARVFEDPENADHYMDGTNYVAFAGVASGIEQGEKTTNTPTLVPSPTPGSNQMFATREPLKTLNLGERAVAKAVGGTTEIGG